MKIYLACGLTHVHRSVFQEYCDFLHGLAAALRAQGGHTVKYALVNSDPQLASKPAESQAELCYMWDRDMVEEADLVIAEASFPSTGLGIEMQLAANKGTPIIICFKDFGCNRSAAVSYRNPDQSKHDLQIGSGYVTLMALGVPTVFRVEEYKSADDGIEKVLHDVALLEKK
jgi:hypothetical protein